MNIFEVAIVAQKANGEGLEKPTRSVIDPHGLLGEGLLSRIIEAPAVGPQSRL